jgi:hypothetical protein
MIWLPWRDRKQFCSVDEIEVKRKEIAYPENVPGPFYVVCDECITCRAPEAVAPDLIGFHEDPSGTGCSSHCYFKKQPASPGELERAIEAVKVNCCGTYRYAGSDRSTKKLLRFAGCGDAIDNP